MRLLTRLQKQNGGDNQASSELPGIRVRPDLTLDYAHSDITEIKKDSGKNTYSMLTNLLGLYGVTSPLPAYYTEELLDQQWDEEDASREFIDIFHHHLYPILYESWGKYQFTHQAIEQKNDLYWKLLFSLFGLGESIFSQYFENRLTLLPYMGIYTQTPRSAAGLEIILRHYLDTEHVNIIPCVLRKVCIPNDQTNRIGELNHALGSSCYLGTEIEDRTGKMIIQVGPIDGDQFQSFVNDSDKRIMIKKLIEFYLIQPLDYKIELLLESKTLNTTVLGDNLSLNNWSTLGLDTWILPETTVFHADAGVITQGEKAFFKYTLT